MDVDEEADYFREVSAEADDEAEGPVASTRQVPNWRAQLLKLPQLSDEEVLATAKELVVKMGKYARTRNTPQSLATPEVWTHLFHSLDTDGSGRISYLEFEECARKMDVSEKMLQRGIKALWRLVDADGSGEATEKDFVLALYRLQLDRWPRLEQEDLERAMVILNAAADKWHRKHPNGPTRRCFVMGKEGAIEAEDVEMQEEQEDRALLYLCATLIFLVQAFATVLLLTLLLTLIWKGNIDVAAHFTEPVMEMCLDQCATPRAAEFHVVFPGAVLCTSFESPERKLRSLVPRRVAADARISGRRFR
eukprot:g14856.t1